MIRLVVFAAAVRDFVADGFRTVSRDEYHARLRVCEACERRSRLFCGPCGCLIAAKAVPRAARCPDTPPRWAPIT